jgi:hypothetical protein
MNLQRYFKKWRICPISGGFFFFATRKSEAQQILLEGRISAAINSQRFTYSYRNPSYFWAELIGKRLMLDTR